MRAPHDSRTRGGGGTWQVGPTRQWLVGGGGTGRARLGFKPAAWPWRAAAARAVTAVTSGAGNGGGQHEGGGADRH
uniref:Uncharacterized protein n=1 Tax=Oryza glaberrima TaxID=4538 RepID=I1QHI8_ORYGL